jgi:hypothetical protein
VTLMTPMTTGPAPRSMVRTLVAAGRDQRFENGDSGRSHISPSTSMSTNSL